MKNNQAYLERYYCPLAVSVFEKNEYGDYDEAPILYDGRFARHIEDKILLLLAREDQLVEDNLAMYYEQAGEEKVRSVQFGVKDVDGMLYGCIRVNLDEPFTPAEEASFRDWLEGQCSDGYGEGLEQRPIQIEEGEAYVHFWRPDAGYFLLNEPEFEAYQRQNTDIKQEM